MGKTLTVRLTGAAIRNAAASTEITELKDPRFPVRFRYKKDRAEGSYYVVTYRGGKAKWHKAANYPTVKAPEFLAALPKIQHRLELEHKAAGLSSCGWQTAGNLLAWYSERINADGRLSKHRKASTLSVLRCHLIPCIGSLLLSELNHANIDTLLIWPLQARYSLSHVRLVFSILKVAVKRAHELRLLNSNLLAGIIFTHFIKVRIAPKGSRLRPSDADLLLAQWAVQFADLRESVAMATLMLAHGTRIGETRQAKWRHFDLTEQMWHIPANDTKTKREHTLPLSAQACAFLKRYRLSQVKAGYEGAYLFPGPKGLPISEKQAHSAFACISDGEWTSHDLRKLARTAWTDLGVDYLIGELLLNHALKSLDVAYIHTTATALKRDALERWHAWLDERGFGALHSQEVSAAKI
ncbi:Integrase [Pseudomonas guineae]|uniref:Integrase n=1 Tax=Pseudomonas guineae TaxID=425504 RepID=A0A1I3HYM2_9PSED|nr:site-specific integrase [Pseudomonas guineae]SFI40804.1 Integrase [Pseudomonas guineae]